MRRVTRLWISGVICALVGVLAPVLTAQATPFATQHLQLWLRADAGLEAVGSDLRVLKWRDQSGRGNDAWADFETAPKVAVVEDALRSFEGVQFDTAAYLRVPHDEALNADGGLTLFAVYRNLNGNRLMQKKSHGSVTEDSWFVIATQGLGVAGTYRSGTPTLFPGGGQDLYITSHVFDPSRGEIRMYRDGALVETLTGVSPQVPNADDLFIGKRDTPGTSEAPWQGDLFEILLFDVALDEASRQSVEQYLFSKYRGAPNLADQPFRPAQGKENSWWEKWGGEYPFVKVGTEQGIGPLALVGIQTKPIGTAYVFESAQPDLFAHVNGRPAPGLYVIPWVGTSEDGTPFFGTPVPVNVPTNHPVISNGSVVQVGKEIHAMWIDEGALIHGVFDKGSFTFRVTGQAALPRLPRSANRVHFVPLADGRVDVLFEISDGTPWYPEGQDRTAIDFHPYDSAGIWQGGPRYRTLYAATYPSLLSGKPSDARLFAPSLEQVRFDMGQITNVRLGGAHDADIVVGSRFGPIYYYRVDGGKESPLATDARRHLVGTDGNTLRHPTINASPVAYPNPATGYSDLIVGGEGALYYYRFTGEFTAEGNPIFADPVPVLQRNADLYGGSLPTPSVVDWNGDGRLDIVAGNSEGRVLFFENIGSDEDPKFLPGVAIEAGGREIFIQGGYRGSIQGMPEARWGYAKSNVVDWNQDGLYDIVMGDITGGYSIYINRGTPTEPKLDPAQPLYHDGLELVGHWRVRPAVAHVGDETALIIVDGEGHLHLYWRVDDYNVRDGGKLRLDDGSLISGAVEYAGHTGRLMLDLADWDGDGVLDLVIGTGRVNGVPNPVTGFPMPTLSTLWASMVLFMKNVGTNTEPVFQHPVPFMYRGEPVIPGGTHSVSPVVTRMGGGDGPNILVGNEAGRFILYRHEHLSLYPDPVVAIASPEPNAIVSGVFTPDIRVVSPVSELTEVRVTLGTTRVYEGTGAPSTWRIDVSELRSAKYVMTVYARNAAGRSATASVVVDVDNRWSLTDELLPPLKSGFFGTVDRSRTADRSAGWAYDERKLPFVDDGMLVRQADTTEFLVWEAPNLEAFTIVAYTTDPAALKLETAVSRDRSTWRTQPYQSVVEAENDGWHKVVMTGEISDPTQASWFRIELSQGELGADEVVLGKVELVGDGGKASRR